LTRSIVLLTDFGHRDPFVGIMKCVLATIAPRAQVIDLVHDLPAQDIHAGALALDAALPYLPPRAVVVAIVDPGVGTERRAIAGAVDDFRFVGPDNGLLARPLARARKIVNIVEPRYVLREVSSTFHGRDVFAPVAAHLARGLSIDKLGPRIKAIESLPIREPRRDNGVAHGEVLLVDRYGNALTNIPGDWTRPGDVVNVRGAALKVARTYADVRAGEPVAVISSNGALEIAVRNGDAASSLGIRRGDVVEVLS
jgi:S-adenosyl-L-methionine hydrolase (adenosine-forming)